MPVLQNRYGRKLKLDQLIVFYLYNFSNMSLNRLIQNCVTVFVSVQGIQIPKRRVLILLEH